MKRLLTMFVISAALVLYAASDGQSPQSDTHHRIVQPDQVQWSSGPDALPPGAQAAVLEGDPKQSGPFTMRLKMPAGYRISPHSHPRQERVTVISGAFKMAMGNRLDESKFTQLPAGGYVTISANQNHFAGTDVESVIQINSEGPWQVVYVNPADDPRTKKK